MPSGLSQVEIVNKALILVGDQTITAMNQNNPRAILMNSLWAGTRDTLLRACPWNFATVRVGIPASATAPVYQWTNAYPIPQDFLYMVSTENNSPYRMEGNNILSDQGSPLNIKYIRQVTVSTEFDSGFANALSAQLAYEASKKLAAEPGLERSLFLDAKIAITDAMRLDGMEDDPVGYPEDSWTSARSGGAGDVSREPW